MAHGKSNSRLYLNPESLYKLVLRVSVHHPKLSGSKTFRIPRVVPCLQGSSFFYFSYKIMLIAVLR